jgi:hypothetical protein
VQSVFDHAYSQDLGTLLSPPISKDPLVLIDVDTSEAVTEFAAGQLVAAEKFFNWAENLESVPDAFQSNVDKVFEYLKTAINWDALGLPQTGAHETLDKLRALQNDTLAEQPATSITDTGVILLPTPASSDPKGDKNVIPIFGPAIAIPAMVGPLTQRSRKALYPPIAAIPSAVLPQLPKSKPLPLLKTSHSHLIGGKKSRDC